MSDRSIELIARGLASDGTGRILLCKNIKHGYYFLPGGHVEFGETAAKALAREFQEETGLDAKVGEPLIVAEHLFERKNGPCHEVNIVFHVELPASVVTSAERKIAFEWIDAAAVSDMDVRPAAIRAWLISGGRSEVEIGWASEGP